MKAWACISVVLPMLSTHAFDTASVAPTGFAKLLIRLLPAVYVPSGLRAMVSFR
jgi:hypothetical protein